MLQGCLILLDTQGENDVGPPPSTPAAALAARQHGLLRLAQLLAAGLSERAITRRVRDGRLHRVYRGVYALGHRALSREGRWLAGVFAAARARR